MKKSADRQQRPPPLRPAADVRRPLGRPGFAWAEILIGVSIVAVSVFAIIWLLGAPERNKRSAAEKVANAVADANLRRRAMGRGFFVGPLDNLSPLVAEGYLPRQDWDALYYSFSGAEGGADPCILASAARKTRGPKGTSKPPYRDWGVCVSAAEEVQRFSGSCTLTCVKAPPPPKPAAPRPAPVAEAPKPPPPRPRTTTRLSAEPMRMDSTKSIAPAIPDLGPDQPEKPAAAAAGCSSTGCSGTDCCDADSDRCVSCPGGSCCQRSDVCKGTCFKDEECSQGCHCEHHGDQSWGSCKVGSFN